MPPPTAQDFKDPRTTLLVGLGLALWVGSLLGSFWSGTQAMGAVALGGLGALLAGIGWASRKKPPEETTAPSLPSLGTTSRSKRKTAPRKSASTSAAEGPPPELLSAQDRERLLEWLAEPIAILEGAEKKKELTGFNRAHSCRGMGEAASWRHSVGWNHPDADALLAAAQEAIKSALIEAAEHFSPLLEAVGERGGEPVDLAKSRERIMEVRRRTIALLSQLRARLAALPVSTQESFEF